MAIKAFFERSKGYGTFLDEHNGNFKLNAGNRKNDKDNLEWVIINEWNDDSKSYEFGESKRPMSVYLGDKEKAIETLEFHLAALKGGERQGPTGTNPGDPAPDDPDVPF